MKFWGDAVLTTSYLINRLPSIVLDSKTPTEVLSSFYPYMPTSNNLTPRILGVPHLSISIVMVEVNRL